MKYPNKSKPIIPSFSKFGAIRKYDVHTGVDLHCEENESVFAIESGIVKYVAAFTGASAGSPWWEDTSYVGILGGSGYIVYG